MSFKEFIKKWEKTGASERANFQPFMIELMALLDVEPVSGSTSTQKADDYAFERPVVNRISNTTKFIDFYRKSSFVMEGKQGSDKQAKPKDTLQYELATGEHFPKDQRVGTARRGTAAWVTEMMKARQQAENYARNLETDQGLPPFIIVVDVGYIIELYADFSGQGKYEQFPNKKDHQIYMDDLLSDDIQTLLKTIWTEPQSLDPSQKAAKVTREVAIELAELGKSYSSDEYDPETVAKFLMRCLFTMFAEDVELIPRLSFETLLKETRDSGNFKNVAPLLEELWTKMDQGGFSTAIREDLMKFNGGLFRSEKGGAIKALPVNQVQLSLLIRAAEKDWKNVEPSIFGTLLERALSPKARHKLGAHYTPRPYVERLVGPTIMEPLRADFDAAKAAAVALLEKKDPKAARQVIKDFHHTLCTIRVLDPACGSGNFLYVAMENMKRLEADVLKLLEDLGENEPRLMLQGETVDPHQFLGLEINEWAVWAAELVLWIGYLQWHFKTFGNAAPSEPVLKDFHNIEKRDALLTWESTELRKDNDGNVVTRWDGESMILSNVTGEEIPDPEARVEVYTYHKPQKSVWPKADFIVGNPPFLGGAVMRAELGDGYVDALRLTYKSVGESADFVMYWWEKAALLLQKSKKSASGEKTISTRGFGFITTNSLRQIFNRRVLSKYLDHSRQPLSLLFAIPDHPWVDNKDGAAVRIAMTVASKGKHNGRLLTLKHESKTETEVEGRKVNFTENTGTIFANLQTGVDVTKAVELQSNCGLAQKGVALHGGGFTLTQSEASQLPQAENLKNQGVVRDYLNGRDFTQLSRNLSVIDFFGVSEDDAREKYPELFQIVLDNVKPTRDAQSNNSADAKKYAENWWLFGKTRPVMRKILNNLPRFISTVQTSKHSVFQFLPTSILPDATIIVIGLANAWQLSICSSNIHIIWALSSGGRLGVGNDPRYNHTRTFNPFPFPDLNNNSALLGRLAELGERLDKHRKDRQAEHPKLTLTQMYNVLEKLRAGEAIEGNDKQIYKDGLIGILRQIHDEIDVSTAEAYGWPTDLSDEDILKRLVALNRERALEETKGLIRWLRPEYQNPDGSIGKAKTSEMDLDEVAVVDANAWPKALPEQMAAVREALLSAGQANVEDIRSQFKRAQTRTVKERLDTLAALGQAEILDDGRYAA